MPYKWTLTSGNLPPGLSLQTVNSGRGAFLIGKPTELGTFNWRYTVTDDTIPTPQSVFHDYTMSVSSFLMMRGSLIVPQNWVLGDIRQNEPLNPDLYTNILSIEEAGSHNSVFTAQVISGTKPSWLNITVTPTINRTDGVPVAKYCFAYVNFSGTAGTDLGYYKFKLRLTSTSGGYIDTSDIYITVVQAGTTIETPAVTSFKLSADKTFISEGESVTVTLTTTDQADNSTHAYKITGVSAGDINVPLEGNITVTQKEKVTPIYTSINFFPFGSTTFISGYKKEIYQEGTLTITASADLLTEGTEVMAIELPSRVQFNLATDVPRIDVSIVDTSVAPAVPTFELLSDSNSVQEGYPFTITLVTTNVSEGTTFDYSIEGVALNTFLRRSDGSIEPTTGKFVVDENGLAFRVFTPLPNETVEPNRVFKFSIPSKNLSKSVTITDASPTFSLTRSATEIAEGESVTFNLKTTTVADGTQYQYKITGIQQADIDKPLTGTLTVNKNSAGITIAALADQLTETSPDGSNFEIMSFEIPSLNLLAQVRIRDISLTPPPLRYNLLVYDYSDPPVLLDGSQTIEVGESFKIMTFATAGAAGTSVAYKIEGIPPSNLEQPLTGTIPLTGVSTIAGNFARGEKIFNTKKSGENIASTVTISLPNVTTDGTNQPVVSFKIESPAIINPPVTNPVCDTGYTYNPTTKQCEKDPVDPPPPSTDPVDVFIVSQEPNNAIPVGYVGVRYPKTFYLTHTGGTSSLTWSKTVGTLPPGLTIETENKTLSGSRLYLEGAPTTAGLYQGITIQGTDGSTSDTVSFSIIVTAPPNDGGGPAPNPGGDNGTTETAQDRPGDYTGVYGGDGPATDTPFTAIES